MKDFLKLVGGATLGYVIGNCITKTLERISQKRCLSKERLDEAVIKIEEKISVDESENENAEVDNVEEKGGQAEKQKKTDYPTTTTGADSNMVEVADVMY